jgi:hypothetical protein
MKNFFLASGVELLNASTLAYSYLFRAINLNVYSRSTIFLTSDLKLLGSLIGRSSEFAGF